jgi:TRAP transporter TAXI family solute receptor
LRSLASAALALALTTGPAALAQDREDTRDRINRNTLFIAGGSVGASYHALANDIALVASGGELRVVAVTGSSGVQNVRDLMYLRNIDLALTNVRNLNGFLASGELGRDLQREIVYIAPLATEEMHVLAQPEIASLQDLKGKRVGLHVAGSSTASAAAHIFKTLGIDVQIVNHTQPEAIEKMRRRELDATVCICPKPVPAYDALKAEAGFRFLAVPYPPALEAEFLPSKISAEDYPGLLPAEGSVETVALMTLLVTRSWPRGTVRHERNVRFVEAFFSRFQEFLKPPRQASWKSVNIAARVRGWQRFQPAQDWLDREEREAARRLRSDFDKFLDERAKRTGPLSTADRARLFREFQKWRRN